MSVKRRNKNNTRSSTRSTEDSLRAMKLLANPRIPQLGLAIITTTWLLTIVFKVHPKILEDLIIPNSHVVPILTATWATAMWLYLLTKQSLRTLIWSASVCLILIFARIGIGHTLNIGLIIGVAYSLDYYLRKDTV